ncbi:Cell wall assembly regulator SMI1 [Thiothrix caldifontis]|uniref:Cell wall assembly regulator SMI1 n=1 Tax=Thiothrix caldifontis TaxID=525918 RepID=A0A1H4FYM2_9GAMM|nr:SMI1/KNR4 family protein [Thiothrix caldifontis]SEB02207.1 Cell wall assembly regulator SMI1 [Thiothrix caldifontis]
MTKWKELKQAIIQKSPELGQYLNSGVDPEKLVELESRLGVALPMEYKEIYLQNDGEVWESPGFFFGLHFLTLESVISELDRWEETVNLGYNDLTDFCESKPLGHIQDIYANKKWLPLMDDAGGNFIGLDFDPGPKGISGQIINFGRDEDVKYVFSSSIGDFLDSLKSLVFDKETQLSDYDGSLDYKGLHFIDALKRN